MKIGVGKAHGKIILMGEHSVVYYQPAIALPFKQVEVTTTISPSDKLTVDCVYHTGFLSESPKELDNLKTVVSETLFRLKEEQSTFNIKIDSSIPAERGMGSSAAVANATIRAIYDYFKTPLDSETLFELAQVSETIAHGSPSGLDAQVTVSSKPLYFIKNQTSEAFDINTQGYLVIADTGEKGQTKLSVASLSEKRKANPERVEEMISGLGHLTKSVRDYLNSNQLKELGNVMNASQSYLKEMGISNQILDKFVDISVESGALGAKLTGGGWGGCMLALTDNLFSAQHIQENLLKNEAKQTWLLSLSV